MHYATVKVCVAVGDINPKYPLITQPDNVCLSFENYMCIGFCCIPIILNVFVGTMEITQLVFLTEDLSETLYCTS